MRTTVTLDRDVERLIRDAMRERAQKFVQKTFRMGEEREFRWDKALAAADAIEDKELNRRLALRK